MCSYNKTETEYTSVLGYSDRLYDFLFGRILSETHRDSDELKTSCMYYIFQSKSTTRMMYIIVMQ